MCVHVCSHGYLCVHARAVCIAHGYMCVCSCAHTCTCVWCVHAHVCAVCVMLCVHECSCEQSCVLCALPVFTHMCMCVHKSVRGAT